MQSLGSFLSKITKAVSEVKSSSTAEEPSYCEELKRAAFWCQTFSAQTAEGVVLMKVLHS